MLRQLSPRRRGRGIGFVYPTPRRAWGVASSAIGSRAGDMIPTAARAIQPDVPVESGTTGVPPMPKEGPPWASRYSVIYVRRDGRWLVAGEREYPGEEPSHRDRLKELEWLLGDWVDESEDSVIHTSCRHSP